jgi:hypothetical protein
MMYEVALKKFKTLMKSEFSSDHEILVYRDKDRKVHVSVWYHEDAHYPKHAISREIFIDEFIADPELWANTIILEYVFS